VARAAAAEAENVVLEVNWLAPVSLKFIFVAFGHCQLFINGMFLLLTNKKGRVFFLVP
jgi:hypothetical protein